MTVNLSQFKVHSQLLACCKIISLVLALALALVLAHTCKYKNYLRAHFTLVLAHGSLRVLAMLWMIIMSNICRINIMEPEVHSNSHLLLYVRSPVGEGGDPSHGPRPRSAWSPSSTRWSAGAPPPSLRLYFSWQEIWVWQFEKYEWESGRNPYKNRTRGGRRRWGRGLWSRCSRRVISSCLVPCITCWF